MHRIPSVQGKDAQEAAGCCREARQGQCCWWGLGMANPIWGSIDLSMIRPPVQRMKESWWVEVVLGCNTKDHCYRPLRYHSRQGVQLWDGWTEGCWNSRAGWNIWMLGVYLEGPSQGQWCLLCLMES